MTSPKSKHGRTTWLAPPLLLLIATVSVYAVTGNFGFLVTWDDKDYLISNETVNGFTWTHLKEAFSGYYMGNYAPMHILSYMADHALWGLNPAGYHMENVLLHGMNGVLFYLLLRRLAMTEWQAAAAAWIFLFHPVQVETVAWVSQRKNLLAMLFFLAALLSYHAYCQRQQERLSPYLSTLLSLLAATLSKSVAVIFPAAALLYDLTYRKGTSRPLGKRHLDKLPFIAIASFVAWVALVSQAGEAGGRTEYPGGTPAAAFFTMVPVLVSYLRDCFYPCGLSPFYMIEIRQHADVSFILALCLVAALAGVGVWLYFRVRPMLFWYGLFFVALLPVMQFVPLVTLKNDRYLYFPLLGFAVLAVTAANCASRRLPSFFRRCLVVVLTSLLLLLPFLAHRQTLHWRDDFSIWTRAIDVDPENRLGWRLLAMVYTMRGDAPNATRAFDRVLELHDKYGPLHGHSDL